MSTELDIFESGGLPAHFRGEEISETTKALAGGGGDGKRISIRGSVYRMIVGGQEVAVNEDRAMNIVIAKSAGAFSRTYYKEQFDEDVKTTPVCWSDDGASPSENAHEPQAKTCATCPQNIKGSGNENSRACRYSARLAVLLDGDLEGDLYSMSIPATSIFGDVDSERYNSLQKYAQKLASHKFDITHVVTEMKFDTAASTPKLMFRAIRPLTAEEWGEVKAQRETPEIESMVGPRTYDIRDEESVTEDIDDDGEDEAPTPKPKAKPKPKPKAPPAPSMFDAGDAEEDEEETAPEPKPEPKKPAGGFKPVSAEEDDEDEEDVPVPRKKAKPTASAATKKSAEDILADWDDED